MAANAGGPGGGAGGARFPFPGLGPGGGLAAGDASSGAGGGGFGGAGARGGQFPGGAPAGAGGAAYGGLGSPLQGGSGGGGGGDVGSGEFNIGVGGGGGGGAIGLYGSTVTIGGDLSISANGGDGGVGDGGGSGGGSGGYIVIHGDTVDIPGTTGLNATGGDGGKGSGIGGGAGGGGGGGRVALQYRTLIRPGDAAFFSGFSGFATTSACACSTQTQSVDTRGGDGVATKSQAASAATLPATSVVFDGATLKGTVNPNGTLTSFHFEYGPTTSYGSSTPSAEAGEDKSDQVVARTVVGLEPNTTYHYRVVATDAADFVTPGEDHVFTTPADPRAQSPGPANVLAIGFRNRWNVFRATRR